MSNVKWANDALLSSADEGDVQVARQALGKGAQIDALDEHGGQALSLAARRGHVEVVKMLIARGAVLNGQDAQGFTALMRAAAEGRVDCLRELLAAGAGLEFKNRYGDSALTLAARGACERGVRGLLGAGADPHARCGDHWTALMRASASVGGSACVEALLEAGSDVDASTPSGWTAVSIATLYHNDLSVAVLGAAKASLDLCNDRGDTPLMIAAQACGASTVEALLAAGAAPCRAKANGKTALDLAQDRLESDSSDAQARHVVAALEAVQLRTSCQTPSNDRGSKARL
jgi:ankyrin repeat protein